MTRLTKQRLEAMQAALVAMLAGEDHEGDWPSDVSRDDLESALDWTDEQLAKRSKKRTDHE